MLRAARHPAVEGLSRRGVLRALAAAGIGFVAGGGAHGYLYERHRVGVTRADASGVGPAGAARRPARRASHRFSSDRRRSARDIQLAVDLARAETPDLIVLGGDYVTHQDRRFMGRCADLLRTLSAPFGVFGVLGNHDDEVEMPRELKRRGIEMLNDARTTLTIRGETLDLVGLRFWTRQTSDLARLMRGGTTTTMLLAHDPRRLTQAAALNVPADALRSHPRRPDRHPRRGRHRGPQIPGHRGHGAARKHHRVRQPRDRHRLHPVPDQLSAGSGAAHAEAARGAAANQALSAPSG